MSSFLMELCLTEKSYKVPFEQTSLWSSFVKSFDTLPKQKLYLITYVIFRFRFANYHVIKI